MIDADQIDYPGYLRFLRVHTRNVLTMLKRENAGDSGYYKRMLAQYEEAGDLLKEMGDDVSTKKDAKWKISYNNGNLRLMVNVI